MQSENPGLNPDFFKARPFGAPSARKQRRRHQPSYVGPLDLVPGAVVAYGQRALSAVKRGTALYTVREDMGDTTQSFNSDATTGEAPASDIVAFLNGANGFIPTWNDQSGNAVDLSNLITPSQQWQWSEVEQGGKPALLGVANGRMFATLTIPNGAATIFWIVKDDAHLVQVSGSSYIEVSNAGGLYCDLSDGTREAGGETASVPVAGYHLIEAAWEFGAVSFALDGADVPSNHSFDSGSAPHSITVSEKIDLVSGRAISEMLLYPTKLSDANRLAIRQNMATYYGITLAP